MLRSIEGSEECMRVQVLSTALFPPPFSGVPKRQSQWGWDPFYKV